MQKHIYICDRCKLESYNENFLYSINIEHKNNRISDKIELCYNCYVDVIHLIKHNFIAIDPDDIIYNKSED